MAQLEKEGTLEKKMKLTTTISTGNMNLFDHNGQICKYQTPEDILKDFFTVRIVYYEKRKVLKYIFVSA